MGSFARVSPKERCSSTDRNRLLLTCEHGGARIPAAYRKYFVNAAPELASHRGYDMGALALAKSMSRTLQAPLLFSTVSRLLVELNRSPQHPALFSEFSRILERTTQEKILEQFYWPHRRTVEALAADTVERGGRAIHVGVHTFTPVLHGVERAADIGFLYDPARPHERAFCGRWQEELRELAPHLRIRRNYPYRGAADGLTTHLRRRFADGEYLGIELEVNNRLTTGDATARSGVHRAIVQSLDRTLR